tara:strand:- start:286 stop:1374 length:1089 start_codon:yes stop_codon:yes gene_type:complete
MKKKIIFFCPSIEVGGVEKNLFKVVNYFSYKKKEDVSIITFDQKNIKRKFDKQTKFIDANFLGNKNLPYFVKVLFCIIGYFLQYGLQKNLTFVSFQSNLYFILLAKLTCNKIVARSNAAPNYYISNQFKLKLFQIIYSLADKIIVNSKDFKKIFFKKFKVMPITIYNPSFKKKYSKLKKIRKLKKNKINFLNVARLTDQKNQIIILRALSEFENLDFNLIIVGDGSKKKELEKYISSCNLKNKVKIINDIANPRKFLEKCDVFILSSKFEGLPNVLIEAQILNKFIISSNCPTGPREILKNGNAGYLFKNDNYKDLKRNIKKFIIKKNSNEIQKKIKLGFKNLNRFDEKKNLEKYYKEIINL